MKVDVLKTQLVVIEEVNLPRGEWKSEALDFYVAFGAPGAPRAIDARLACGRRRRARARGRGRRGARRRSRAPSPCVCASAASDATRWRASSCTSSASRSRAPSRPATWRRSASGPSSICPRRTARGARGVVVRLGASRGTPLTLGRLSARGQAGRADPVARRSAPLRPRRRRNPARHRAVPAPRVTAAPPATPPIAPVLAVRHPSDDLCIRFWTPP